MNRLCSMRDALADPELFGTVLSGSSWASWRTLLIAAMGEELTDAERLLFVEMTGREREPGILVEELWAIVGRRGGKTRAAATLVSYLATLVSYEDVLAPGERGVIPLLSASTTQAAKALEYVAGIFNTVPKIGAMKLDRRAETSDLIRLRNNVDIAIRPANWRTIRSITACAAVGDEIAFWRNDEDAANSDKEILDALRPALATTRGPLICITSPYAKKGETYTTYRQHYGRHGDPRILVAKAPSRLLNPTLAQSVVDRALERDPDAARAEWLAEFRSDLSDFVSREVVEAAVDSGVTERAPLPSVHYEAFVDPAGGSGKDSMTMAVGHTEKGVAVVDAVIERAPPFSPAAVVEEFVALLKRYRVREVRGDRYAGEFAREPFRKLGITYTPSDRSKIELYRDFLPVLNSGQVRLLDSSRLVNQLCSLERRVNRGGRDSIDHPPGGHDDLANVVAGVARPLIVEAGPPVAAVGTYSLGSSRGWQGLNPTEQPPEWFRLGWRYPPNDRRWHLDIIQGRITRAEAITAGWITELTP